MTVTPASGRGSALGTPIRRPYRASGADRKDTVSVMPTIPLDFDSPVARRLPPEPNGAGRRTPGGRGVRGRDASAHGAARPARRLVLHRGRQLRGPERVPVLSRAPRRPRRELRGGDGDLPRGCAREPPGTVPPSHHPA